MRLPRILPWLLLCLAVPAGAAAQQAMEETPPTLRLSFYMCDTDRLEEVMEEVGNRDVPVWQEIVDRGDIEAYGYFVHAWASEWNVGVYTIAPSIQAVVEASEEAGEVLDGRYGGQESVLAEACPHHRDGFYTMGPSTTDREESPGGDR